jgi:beta-lactamase class A
VTRSVAVAAALLALAVPARAAAPEADLEARLAGLARGVHGKVGVCAVHVEFALANDWYGLVPPAESTWTAARLKALRAAVPAERRARGAAAFLADPRDRATPAAYARFLVELQSGVLLGPASTDTLLAMLGRCTTGAGRLPAGLPPGTRLAHKTGTGGTWREGTNAVNDAGIVTLPGGGGHVALVVFVENVRGPVADAERAIARITREVFEHWNAPE